MSGTNTVVVCVSGTAGCHRMMLWFPLPNCRRVLFIDYQSIMKSRDESDTDIYSSVRSTEQI